MARVIADEVIEYAKITYTMLSEAEVNGEIEHADCIVDFEAPADGSPRSRRAEPLRARCTLLLASAGCYRKMSPWAWVDMPTKETMTTPGLMQGPDSPNAENKYSAMLRVADAFREEAYRILGRIAPPTSTIEV